jgi:hypothetical protein
MIRRRSQYDPLAPIPVPSWMVTRSRHRALITATAFEPHANVRAALEASRQAYIDAGWQVDEIRRSCAFFYASKGYERLEVGIETRDPMKSDFSENYFKGPSG